MCKYLLFALIFLHIFSCKKLFYPDDELSNQRKNYTGSELRIDGIYYRYNSANSVYLRYVLYKNGVLKYLFGSSEIEKDVHIPDDLKDMWGIFLVDGNNITIEEFVESNDPNYHVYTSHGIILNDTTFQLTESYRLKKDKKTEQRQFVEIYHFYKYSPKPDSTNEFIQ